MRVAMTAAALVWAVAAGLTGGLGHRAEARSVAGADPDRVAGSLVESRGPSLAPLVACAPGFVREGSFLCITGSRGPNSFVNAGLDCRDLSANVADYITWRYRIFRGDGVAAPVGWWLGGITADDTALFVNSANVANFDGETSRFDSRNYACAYFTK